MTGALADLLLGHPFGDDENLLHSASTSVTRGAAVTAARQLADELAGAGVAPGNGVALKLPNGPDAVVAMMGIWLAGAVMIPLNPRAPEREVHSVLEQLEPAALVQASGVARLEGCHRFERDTAFVLWTSGTTGRPKPILHTHTAYLELLDRVLLPLRGGGGGAKRPSPNLIPVSLALNAGIYNALFGLRAGAALVIMERFDPLEFQVLVGRFAIRSTVLPPAAIASLNNEIAVQDLTPLRYVRSITAPLSPTEARRFRDRFGAFVLNSYGQAEIGEVIGWTAADAREHPEKLGAAGRPHPGVAVKVVDPQGAPLPDMAVGELFVRPPAMAAGYAGEGDLADRLDPEGYLRTGDLGAVDAEGFVWVHGRVSDLINRGGNKVYPDEVEEVLSSSPSVLEAAVVGRAHDRLGQVPVAFVVTDGPVSDEELEAHCRAHLTPYKVPIAFHRVRRLPRNPAGKLLRRQLAGDVAGTAADPEYSAIDDQT